MKSDENQKKSARHHQLVFTEVDHGKFVLTDVVADDFEDQGILQALMSKQNKMERAGCEALRYALKFESATYLKDEKIKLPNLF